MFGSIKDIVRGIRIFLLQQIVRLKSEELALPLCDNVLVIAPHPDDEVIGCSGLIQQCIKTGKKMEMLSF